MVSFCRVVASHSDDLAVACPAGDDGPGGLRQKLVAELVHHAIGMECRLHDLLIVDQPKAAVEDRVGLAILLEDIRENPVGERINQADGFEIRLRDERSSRK
jgi:hypothetical protein